MKPRIKSMIWNVRKQKTTNQQQEKRILRKEVNISSLWDNFKRSGFRIIRVPEGQEQEIRNLSKRIVTENFPNLVKEIDMQVQEVERVPIMMDAKRLPPRHIIIKTSTVKDKERLFKAREKQLVTRRLLDGSREGENG